MKKPGMIFVGLEMAVAAEEAAKAAGDVGDQLEAVHYQAALLAELVRIYWNCVRELGTN